MGMSRVAVAGPTISPLLIMAAASFAAGMVLPVGLMSTKYAQLSARDNRHQAEIVQAHDQLARAQQAQEQLRLRLRQTQQQLTASEQALKAQQLKAQEAAKAASQPKPPSPAVAQASAAAAAAAAALKREQGLEAQAQRDNDALRRQVQALRSKVSELDRARAARQAPPKPLERPPAVAKPAPQGSAEPHVALAATDAAAVGIRALAPGMVLLANGERVLVGQQFPSGETLLSVDPGTDEVRTNKRTLLLFFKH